MRIREIGPSPYEVAVREIEKGNIDPFDVDLNSLIKLFTESAKDLENREFFIEAGIFLETAVRLMKLQLRTIFPEIGEGKRKVTIKEVKEVLEEVKDEFDADTMEWLYEYLVPVGRPVGKKSEKRTEVLETISIKEIPLHRETDWHSEAKRVYEEIRKGVFKIRTLKDFIAFLYAYMEYDDLNVRFEKLL